MMATNLIKKLQELIDKYGDCPVFYRDIEFGYEDVDEITYSTSRKHYFIN